MQCILAGFYCCYSNKLRYRPFQFLTNTSISSHILANHVILTLQMFELQVPIWDTLSHFLDKFPLAIIAVSTAKHEGLYCFFGCHRNT